MTHQNNTILPKDSVKKKMIPFYIIQVLEEETDNENPLLPSEIKARINNRYGNNIVSKEDTILENIKAINEFYFDKFDETEIIQSKLLDNADKYKNNPRFYMEQRRLDFSEISYLADLILNSKTLASKYAQDTYSKLLSFLSKYQQKAIKGIVLNDGSAKTPNIGVYLNMEKIQQSIAEKQNIKFKYCEYNLKKQLVLKNRGDDYYIISPYGTMCSNGGYYLIGYHLPTHSIRAYRVDKIKDIISDTDTEYFLDKDFDLKLFVKNSVFMHTDINKVFVKLRCGMNILDDVIERFENCRLFPDETSQQHFIVEIPDTTKQGMLYWVLQFSSACELLEPEELRDEVKATLAQALEWYKG